jgi:hypothetical protein
VPGMKIKDLLSEMAGELAGTWVISVNDNDGMLLSSWQSPDNKVSPESLAGFIQTINSAIDAFNQSVASFGKLDDVIYSTSFSNQLIKPIADGQCFIIISAPHNVPLGMIRMVANNYVSKFEQVLPSSKPMPSREIIRTVVYQ